MKKFVANATARALVCALGAGVALALMFTACPGPIPAGGGAETLPLTEPGGGSTETDTTSNPQVLGTLVTSEEIEEYLKEQALTPDNQIDAAFKWLADNAEAGEAYTFELTTDIEDEHNFTIANSNFHDKTGVTVKFIGSATLAQTTSDAPMFSFSPTANSNTIIFGGDIVIEPGTNGQPAFLFNVSGQGKYDNDVTFILEDNVTIQHASRYLFDVRAGHIIMRGNTQIVDNTTHMQFGNDGVPNDAITVLIEDNVVIARNTGMTRWNGGVTLFALYHTAFTMTGGSIYDNIFEALMYVDGNNPVPIVDTSGALRYDDESL
jgi:hypothetical protein